MVETKCVGDNQIGIIDNQIAIIDVGDGFGYVDHQHRLSLNITNILLVTNITMSPTSLSPKFTLTTTNLPQTLGHKPI